MEITDYRKDGGDKVPQWTEICLNALNLDVNVTLLDMPESLAAYTYEFMGLAQKLPTPGHYLIMVKKGITEVRKCQVVRHECAHIQQYERGDLEITPNTIIYKGHAYYPPYNENDPQERDARQVARKLMKLCK